MVGEGKTKMKAGSKTNRKKVDDAMDGFIDRWRGFLEVAELLVDKISPEAFLQVHNEFQNNNIAQLKEESQGAYDSILI